MIFTDHEAKVMFAYLFIKVQSEYILFEARLNKLSFSTIIKLLTDQSEMSALPVG